MRRLEDQALIAWEKKVRVKRCECGNTYSFEYDPVMDDPGACQDCRGAGGELIY